MVDSNNNVVKELDSGVFDVYIGQRLKLRRTMLKMSQDELATMVGVTFQQIQKYESGANRISASRLFVFSKILNVDISFFFEGLERKVPSVEFLCNESNKVSENIKEFDPMLDTETLQLVNAYWKIQDEERRQKILDFILSMI